MLNLFAAKSEIREERGPDWFLPAYRKAHRKRPNVVTLIATAREDLLGIFSQADYQSRVDAMNVLTRQIVLVNSPGGVKHVMATRNDNYERKSPQMRRALELLIGDGLFISDGDTWKQRRPLVSDIMHKNRLPVFGPVMERAAGEFVERWAGIPQGKAFDALTEMAELTAVIISRSVFGSDLDHASAAEVIGGFTDFQADVDSVNYPYFLGQDDGAPIKRTKRLQKSIERVHGVIDRVVTAHLEGQGDHRSMVDALVERQRRNPELGLTRDALRNEAATIFMAGHETTAATLTWALYLVANSPWAERAALAEIHRVCGDRAPTIADVPHLDYCRAIIEETLRLYPPVPILSRQTREADRVEGVDVRPASLVIVSPWLLQRSPAHFPRPHHFRPERFVTDRPTPYTYAPFAVGPRICAGLAFGLSESILCLATLLQRFKVRVPEGTVVEPVCRLTLRPKNGLPITVTPR